MFWLSALLAVVLGALLAFQVGVNARLRHHVGDPAIAGLISAAVAALATLPLLLPATASAKPGVCQRTTIQAVLVQEDRLTPEGVANGRKVSLVRCGDVTDDGNADALFAVASGGTAGNTRFGVIEGRKNGSPGALVLYKRGYGVGVSRRDRRSFGLRAAAPPATRGSGSSRGARTARPERSCSTSAVTELASPAVTGARSRSSSPTTAPRIRTAARAPTG